ncbi:replication initiation protein [Undibacterium arcticum]|uniref:replication initiation protein n=1 Tax=Undibacterium arcticum TaxID=1762892 RepID=UPI0036098DA3
MAKKPEANSEQFSLDIFQLKPQILKKPVQAVHMGVIDGSMTRTQRLMWNAMLKNAHDGTSRDGMYSIRRSELMDMIDYTSPNRKHFKDTLMQMQKIAVQWDVLSQDGNEMWASCILLPTVAMDKEHVYYSYSPQIKPMLFDPKIFARIDLRIQRQLRLDCATALFEWCVRYRSVKKTVVMPWTEWRWAIYGSIDATSTLNQYKYFKKDKLLPAIREINLRSDITIELIEVKDGRRVADLQFIVQEKPIFLVTDENRKKSEEWDSRLEAWGIKERNASRYWPSIRIMSWRPITNIQSSA